jgi:hypothetical protein
VNGREAFASGCSKIHRCTRSPPSASGFSSLWFGPATNPSVDIVMPNVTVLM